MINHIWTLGYRTFSTSHEPQFPSFRHLISLRLSSVCTYRYKMTDAGVPLGTYQVGSFKIKVSLPVSARARDLSRDLSRTKPYAISC